jgi:hypothetical protein
MREGEAPGNCGILAEILKRSGTGIGFQVPQLMLKVWSTQKSPPPEGLGRG